MNDTGARPLTRGFALGLVALNVSVLGWMWFQQEQRLGALESNVVAQVALVSGTAGPAGGVGTTDPELCWLLGVIADAQGKGSVVAGMGSASDSPTECQNYAMRGARGQGPSGN
jgi:hypothetical protein